MWTSTVRSAGLGEKGVPGNHPPRPTHERDEDVELDAGELHRLAGHLDLAGADVGQHVAHRQALGEGLRLASSEHRAEPSQELAGAEGLGDVVVGANLQPHHAVRLVSPRGEHEDRNAALAADATDDFQAVDAGHHDVEEHGIECPDAQQLEPLQAIRGADHRDAVLLQERLQEFLEPAVVIDEQHPDGH